MTDTRRRVITLENAAATRITRDRLDQVQVAMGHLLAALRTGLGCPPRDYETAILGLSARLRFNRPTEADTIILHRLDEADLATVQMTARELAELAASVYRDLRDGED